MSQQLIYKIHLLTFGDGRRTTELYHVQGPDHAVNGTDNFFLFFDSTDYRHLGKRDLKNLRDLIVDRIQERKFQSIGNLETAQAFELLLKELNSLLPPLLPIGDPEHQSLSILIAHMRSDAISFGYTGSPEAFFIRPKSTGEGLMLNIFEKKDHRQITAALFSQVVSGKISSGDIMFFATSNVLDYLSQEKIKRTLLSLSPQPAAEAIKMILSEARKREKFGMIIVKAIASIPAKQPSSIYSIKEFIGKKDSTQTILTPRPFDLLKTTAAQLASRGKSLVRKSTFLVQDQWKKANKPKPEPMRISKQNETITTTSADSSSPPPAPPAPRSRFSFKDFFEHLPMRQKRLLGIISLLVLLLIGGIVNSFGERNLKQETRQVSAVEKQVTQALSKAEAALIYQNEETARTQYQIIATALQSPEGTIFANDSANREALNRFDIIKQKLFRLTPLNPQEAQIIPLSDLGDTLPQKILSMGKRFVVFDATGKFWTADEVKKTITLFKAQPEQKPATLASSASIILALNDLILDQYDRKLAHSTLKLDPLPARAISSMRIFQDRLYLLVPGEKQIYVYAKSGDTYKKTKSWVEEGVDALSDAVDFAVDGEIFVLKNNGSIARFLKGKPVEMTLDNLEYQISPSAVITPGEKSPIYILDKAAGRIIIYDKAGKLLLQYVVSDAIVDFAVNDANTQIAVLTEKELQIFTIKK